MTSTAASTTAPAASGLRLPPGPKGAPLLGLALHVLRDPLGTLLRLARAYGDIVCIPVFRHYRILLNRPDYIEQVCIIQQGKFHKSTLTKDVTQRLLGQGLLISEGDFWRRQRRLAQPAFHRTRIAEYGETMVECAAKHMLAWRDGETRDMAQEMMGMTLDIAVRTLFGTTLSVKAGEVGASLGFLMRYSLRKARSPVKMPESWPTPNNRRAKRETQFLDSLVYGIIRERQAEGTSNHHNDLLAMLMSAMDEDGTQMTPKQLRDETMTLFLAGHETTALTLSWTWYLLSENPAAEARLHEELRQVLAGRAPEIADLERLPYLRAVVSEVLRLYPAAYIVARTSIAPCAVGGYDFPADTTFIMAQWVMHRDPRCFKDPETFQPERWLDGLEDRLPAGAYFPFGDGPRRCIGQAFALLELGMVIATVAQRFSFKLVPGHRVVPEPLVTLRAKYGIRMTMHARE
ncbi:MAG: cytochrome P450 [Candidatus Acidiferrales bacterium]